MTLKTQLELLATAVGTDVKNIRNTVGTISNLTTADKTNLVIALNEVKAIADTAASVVDDDATAGNLVKTYSADKVLALIAAAKDSILGGVAPEAIDTITELAAFLTDNTVTSGLIDQLSNRVRVDAVQSLDSGKQTQARDNISAASALSVSNLTNAVGDTTTDFVNVYTLAKAQ